MNFGCAGLAVTDVDRAMLEVTNVDSAGLALTKRDGAWSAIKIPVMASAAWPSVFFFSSGPRAAAC
jgi:hypothetical protein